VNKGSLFIEELDGFTYEKYEDALQDHIEQCEYLQMAYAENMGAGGNLVLPRWKGNSED
jgi:hypothetical protein